MDPQTHRPGYEDTTETRFTYHPPTPEQPEVYQLLRDLAHLFALTLEAATFPSRERSLAVTNIEQAVMWANAGIARRGLSDAAHAGAADLYRAALWQLAIVKPTSALVPEASAADPEQSDDPWPPDGHLTPTREPLPAGNHVPTLRSGLRILTGAHHRPGTAPGDCPGCIAQRVLNGEPVDHTAGGW